MLQEAVGNIKAEVQWVAQGGESKAPCLQVELERGLQGLWGEVTELQRSAKELTGITEDLRGTKEGSELRPGGGYGGAP